MCLCMCASVSYQGAEHCARSCARCAPFCLPPEEGVLLWACFLDAVLRQSSEIFNLVYCYLSFLLFYVVVPLFVMSLSLLLLLFYSFLITLRGTCGNISYFFFHLCLSCVVCYFSTSDLFCLSIWLGPITLNMIAKN